MAFVATLTGHRVGEQTSEMLLQSLIELAVSERTSNDILVKKKDGSLRYCIGYRHLNKVSSKDAYLQRWIDSCQDTMSGFSTFDLRAGNHQVNMDPANAEKTTFITREGTFKFKVMPFGLTGAPETCQ